MNALWVELIGHSIAVVVFVSVALYATHYRNGLRRNVHRSHFLYLLLIITGAVFALVHLTRLYFLATLGLRPGLVPWLDIATEYPSVFALSAIVFYLLANKIILERSASPRKVLVVGAHPDDIEVAAGATLAKMHDAGYSIYGLVLTRGEKSNKGRSKPAGRGTGENFLGLEVLRQLEFPDTFLKEAVEPVSQAIAEMIAEVKPELIFTHSAHDLHPDHQAVHAATLRAGREQNAILCYETPSATQEFLPVLYVNVNDYVDIKIEAIRSHWGQRMKPYMHPEQVRGRLAYRGSQAQTEYAEGFEVVRLLTSCLTDV